MNKILRNISVLGLAALAFACDDGDDLTDHSTLAPSSPTVSIEIPNNNVTFVEKDSTFTYTLTLNTPQVVDVAVYLNVIEGDASNGDDFSYSQEVIIPAHRTSATATVKVNRDDVTEGTETFTIQIGDAQTANASIAPQTVKYTILNVTEDDLPVELEWAVNYFDATGTAVDATDVADMIFYITDEAGEVVDGADGAAFESYVIPASWPDGVYYLKAGIYAAIDPGDLGDPPVLDLSITYSQVGKIDETTLAFPAAFNTGVLCEGNLYTLAKVTKVGTDYTVERVGEEATPPVEDFLGAYDCLEPGYGTYTTTFTLVSPGVIENDNFWDSGAAIQYVFDVCGNVTIPAQSFVLGGTTYTVTGAGTFDPATTEFAVDYVVKNAAGATLDANTHTFTRP
jgi:hypothetical protein